MVNAEDINTLYGNSGNIPNPVFKDIISKLIDADLYTDAFSPDNISVENTARNFLSNYKNADGTVNAVPIEVLVDVVSRAIIQGYKSGFTQGLLSIDGSSGIGFQLLPNEAATTNQTNIAACTNSHEAFVLLASEITAIKTALVAMGVTLPVIPTSPSSQLILE